MKIQMTALCLAIAATPALGQKYAKPSGQGSGERSALLQTLQRGKEITVHGERYQQLPEVLAVERASSAQSPREALSLAQAGAAQVLETKGKLVLYRAGGANAALVQRVGGSNVYPTVVNSRTGTLGVLTGTLIVKPKSMASADAIAAGHGLEKTKTYPQLQTVFYRAKPNVDIADISEALQTDSRVESAYPEIIEHVRVPK
jgi:Open reading frame 2 N-terminal domain